MFSCIIACAALFGLYVTFCTLAAAAAAVTSRGSGRKRDLLLRYELRLPILSLGWAGKVPSQTDLGREEYFAMSGGVVLQNSALKLHSCRSKSAFYHRFMEYSNWSSAQRVSYLTFMISVWLSEGLQIKPRMEWSLTLMMKLIRMAGGWCNECGIGQLALLCETSPHDDVSTEICWRTILQNPHLTGRRNKPAI